MTQREDFTRVFSCSQCPKLFATRSNLKRHMENPNIHNIPYIRSRDQKRWKGHAKKVVSKEETTERMRKWRAENREKNRQNDLRCRVYRLARQKFGEKDSIEKQTFIRDEIARRLGRRGNTKSSSSSSSIAKSIHHHHQQQINTNASSPMSSSSSTMMDEDDDHSHHRPWKSELPFYNLPQQKIELPSIDALCPPLVSSTSLSRRTSSSSESSVSSNEESVLVLPPVHSFLYPSSSSPSYSSSSSSRSPSPSSPTSYSRHQSPPHTLNNHHHHPTNIKYVKNTKILDEFVGVVLDYVQDHH
ncbi:hypothetical protein BJ944DRAFT_263291 [Cunninghamella echinulata]|nr:hypothetical protein BJ944DRAFT_263291 [Cunninghamella echinulata]